MVNPAVYQPSRPAPARRRRSRKFLIRDHRTALALAGQVRP